MNAAARGVKLGLLCALLYGALATFMIVLRSSFLIGRVLAPDEALVGTLVANAFGVLWPSLITMLLLGVPAALIGLLTFGLLALVCRIGQGPRTPTQRAVIGFGVSALCVLLVNVFVIQALGGYWSAFWLQGYLFWVGLPSLVFVAATTWACSRFVRLET